MLDRWSQLGLPLIAMICTQTPAVSASQADQLRWLLPLLLAKQPVQGIVWTQLADVAGKAFGEGGVLDEHLAPKPALEVLVEMRKQYLG